MGKLTGEENMREGIIKRIMRSGYDMFTACAEADRIINEFLASGEKEKTVVIRNRGKCVEAFTLVRN